MIIPPNDKSRSLIALGVCLAALAVFTTTLAYALGGFPDPAAQDVGPPVPSSALPTRAELATTSITLRPGFAGLPDRLVIPSVNIDAHVKYVGVNAAGAMATPGNFTDVGWYRYGPAPGEKGSAVIDGHLDNGLGLSGVFKDLEKVRPGDQIYVATDQDKQLRFVVTDVTSYPYDEVPADLIFNERVAPRLRLITCGGTWLGASKTYDHRIVVTAELKPV